MKLGALDSKIDLRDYKYKPAKSTLTPEEYELYHPKAKNQGSVGSCVAHVASEIAEYYNYTQHNSTHRMSAGFIYGYRYDYVEDGMYLRDALKTLKSLGTVPNKYFSHNKEVPEIIDLVKSDYDTLKDYLGSKISTYYRIELSDINSIKLALMNSGPVMASVEWYDDAYVNQSGVLTTSCNAQLSRGYHCILIYGWDTRGWKFLNSWGSSWGEGGTAVLPYDYKLREVWGVTDTITSDIRVPSKNKLVQLILKFISIVLNTIRDAMIT